MVYSTGAHPHIRSADTLAGRYWTACAVLFPCVVLKIISLWPQVFLLLALFSAAAGIHFLSGFLSPGRPRNTGWRQGSLPLFIFLWFLISPHPVSFIASVSSFSFALFFIYEFFGGLGAYPLHPAAAGILFLRIFFPQEILTGFTGTEHFSIWNVLPLLFLTFGGLYLGIQKKIRLLPALSFVAAALLFPLIFARPLDLEILYSVFIFGFYMVSDSNVSPLKASFHFLSGAGAGILMAGLMLTGAGVLPAGAVSLAVWSLLSQAFDSNFSAFKIKSEAHA